MFFFLFFFSPDIDVNASDAYILQLVLAGIEETEGTAAAGAEYKLSVGWMYKYWKYVDTTAPLTPPHTVFEVAVLSREIMLLRWNTGWSDGH